MNITQIRNATQHITFGGKTFLIDPMLAAKGTYPACLVTARAEIRNPTLICLSISTPCSTLMR